MRQEVASWVTVGGLATLAVVVVSVGSRVSDLDSSIAAMMRGVLDIPNRPSMQTLEEDVTRRDGRVIHVTTTRKDDETDAEFIARHDSIVAALKNQ